MVTASNKTHSLFYFFSGYPLTTFHPIVPFQTETSHLIYAVNQMTGFYLTFTTGLKCVNPLSANPTKLSNTLKQFVKTS